MDTNPLFKTVYAITMNPRGRRYRTMKKSATRAGVAIKQFPGVLVSDAQFKRGIPGIRRRTPGTVRGVVGCFLSQRNLLTKIADEPLSDAEGTLILEDDVVFPPTFLNKVKAIEKEVPEDWDVLFLGRTKTRGRRVSKHIIKIGKRGHNWGNWAYVVKNRTVKKKILPYLQTMTDGIDVQFNKFSDKANMYVVQPNILELNKETGSNILKTNKIERA